MKKNGNTGIGNHGYFNTGECNIGNRNSGFENIGNQNAGYDNVGNRNTGHNNTGCNNSGSYNTGSYNTGSYNACDYSAGFFCTESFPGMMLFNKPVELTREEIVSLIPLVELPNVVSFVWTEDMFPDEKETDISKEKRGCIFLQNGILRYDKRPLRETFPEAWEKMDEKTRQAFIDLPNFDAEIFHQITGVDVCNMENKK